MSEQELPQPTPTEAVEPEASGKFHPERLGLLGGVWLGMLALGFFGLSSLLDPTVKLPLIDPLLAKFAAESTRKPETASAKPPATTPKSAAKPQPVAVKPFPKPAPKAVPPSTLVKEPPAPTPAKPQTPQPQFHPRADVPLWVYLVVLASCLSGSSLITYLLYRASRQMAQPTSQPNAQPKPLRQKKRVPVKSGARKVAAQSKKAQPVTAKKAVQPRVQQLPQPQMMPMNPVPAIAPLKISTPPLVTPPTVRIEPVVDPQPISEQPQTAQHAAIAQKTQAKTPQSLVETMDIRRRGSLAPILQDL